jgi:adenylate cyclase
MLGELIPYGGGDPIPMVKPTLLVGRRESCDIVLRFGNVSAHHCELSLEKGYWFVKDLNSRNGTKVNGLRVTARKRIDPGDRLAIAKHNYEVKYSPADLGAEGPPPDDTVLSDILGESLLKSAGLDRHERQKTDGKIGVQRPTEPGEPSEELDVEQPEADVEQPEADVEQPEADVEETDGVEETDDER